MSPNNLTVFVFFILNVFELTTKLLLNSNTFCFLF